MWSLLCTAVFFIRRLLTAADTQLLATVGMGLTNVLATVLSLWLVEKLVAANYCTLALLILPSRSLSSAWLRSYQSEYIGIRLP